MQAMWQDAGLSEVTAREIRVSVAFTSFEDFWDSHSRGGPPGKLIQGLTPAARDQLRARLKERLPIAADGTIAYEGVANAVQGRAPR
jgi:hypothetical protein